MSELSPLRRRGLSLAVMVAVALGVLATSLIATAAPEAPARSAPAGPGDFGRQLARSTQDFFATVATTMPAELGQRYASAALLAEAYRAAGVAEPATSSRPVVRTPAQASAYVREQTSAEAALLADLEVIGLVVSQARPGAHAYSLSAFAQPYAERWAGVRSPSGLVALRQTLEGYEAKGPQLEEAALSSAVDLRRLEAFTDKTRSLARLARTQLQSARAGGERARLAADVAFVYHWLDLGTEVDQLILDAIADAAQEGQTVQLGAAAFQEMALSAEWNLLSAKLTQIEQGQLTLTSAQAEARGVLFDRMALIRDALDSIAMRQARQQAAAQAQARAAARPRGGAPAAGPRPGYGARPGSSGTSPGGGGTPSGGRAQAGYGGGQAKGAQGPAGLAYQAPAGQGPGGQGSAVASQQGAQTRSARGSGQAATDQATGQTTGQATGQAAETSQNGQLADQNGPIRSECDNGVGCGGNDTSTATSTATGTEPVGDATATALDRMAPADAELLRRVEAGMSMLSGAGGVASAITPPSSQPPSGGGPGEQGGWFEAVDAASRAVRGEQRREQASSGFRMPGFGVDISQFSASGGGDQPENPKPPIGKDMRGLFGDPGDGTLPGMPGGPPPELGP